MNKFKIHGVIPVTLNPERAIEFPIGENQYILGMKLGGIHVMTPMREVLWDVVKPVIARMRKEKWFSPELRRGLILETMRIHASNRSLYYEVMRGY